MTRWTLVGTALIAALGCGCRRENASSAPASPSTVAPAPSSALTDVSRTTRPARGRAPVLWVGMDGLDFELLDRFADDGTMPNWKRLAAEGATARLRSFAPFISPILWTTAATGVPPDVHRVLDFQEVDPKSGAKVPISGLSRAMPAVWNAASAAGRKVGVVGWWATHPAEEVNGVFVSDHASPILFDRLPLAGAAYPPSLEPGLAQVASREGAIPDAELARFVDATVSEIGAARSSGAGLANPIIALSRILASTRTTHRIARDLYDRERPDLFAVYYEGTDEVGHVFATSTPPKLPCASDADLTRYGRVVSLYYAEIDRLLGQWMRRAEEDGATLLIHSDHGFKWGADRPCGLGSGNWATAAFWHRPDGVFAAWGKRSRPVATRGNASLYDVAPTVLSLLDLAPDRRMPGKPAAFAFENLRALPATEGTRGLIVARVPAEPMSAKEANEYAKKLMALGYLSPSETKSSAPTGGDRPAMTEGAWNNLGVYYRDTAKDPARARDAFENALALAPGYYSPMFNLAVLARARGDTKSAEDWLLKAMAALGSDPSPAIGAWSREYESGGKTAAAVSLLERAAKAFPQSEGVARERAMLRYRMKDCGSAIASLSPFEAATKEPRTLNDLALFETCRGDRSAVIRLLERSLALEPNQPAVARTLDTVRNARS
ncbi:MAG: alkaline phosphatase family protein [Acidobacteriota bacterium]|nr:alkaline phosphatase family protein [Acidobacteriota bacterium]